MARRELASPKDDKRYVRRVDKGRFRESDDVGRSLSLDRRMRATKPVTAGHGDRGDQRRQ